MGTRDERARKVVVEHVFWSVGGGLLPIPLLDIAAVTAIQLDMLKQLCALYGVTYALSSGKAFVSALAGSLLARMGANAVKLIPGIGTLLGGVSMSILSGASTYAVGMVAIKHFEAGGTLGDLDPKSAKRDYDAEFEKGRDFASRAAKEKRGSK